MIAWFQGTVNLSATVLLIAIVAAPAQPNRDTERSWFDEFMKWAFGLPIEIPLARMESMYREQLAKDLRANEVEQRWAAIQRQQRQSEEWLRFAANRSYAQGWYEGKPASKFLVEFATGKRPGKALDCGWAPAGTPYFWHP
jgi:hypothetical protein